MREPLLHFILAGILLYVVFELTSAPTAASHDIVVDETALSGLMVFMNPQLSMEQARSQIRHMEKGDLSLLIDRFVEEEMLVREARAAGLDQNDYVSRRRLVNQLLYITEAFVGDVSGITEQEASAWYAENRSSYSVPEKITFTHVFIKAEQRQGATLGAAHTSLQALNENAVSFNDAISHGDRFLYHRNYVEKTHDEIASHFGGEFADAVFKTSVDNLVWQGPLRSSHGWHSVLLTARTPAYLPPIEEVRRLVNEQILAARLLDARQQLVEGLHKRYNVKIQLHAEGAS